MKKVDESYFVELEKRERAEAKRISLAKRRRMNNEMLKARLSEIRAESELLKKKFAGTAKAIEKRKRRCSESIQRETRKIERRRCGRSHRGKRGGRS